MTAHPIQVAPTAQASDEETIAMTAAIEQFIRDTSALAGSPATESPVSPWKQAALLEGVSRQPDQ